MDLSQWMAALNLHLKEADKPSLQSFLEMSYLIKESKKWYRALYLSKTSKFMAFWSLRKQTGQRNKGWLSASRIDLLSFIAHAKYAQWDIPNTWQISWLVTWKQKQDKRDHYLHHCQYVHHHPQHHIIALWIKSLLILN